jgi:hypothetical protein
MQTSKLVGIFLQFSGYERANLRKLVHSAYFNKREDVQKLFEYLEIQAHKKVFACDKAAAWAFACPEKPYEDAAMRYLMTLLLQLFEQFLQLETFLQDDPFQARLYLAKAYQKIQLPQSAMQNLQLLGKQLHAPAIAQNSQHLQACYAFEKAQQQLHEDLDRNSNRSLQPVADSLEKYFVAERLRQACELLAHQTVYKIEYDTSMLGLVLGFLETQRPDWLKIPAIGLYYYYYQATTQKGESSEGFFELFSAQLLQLTTEFPTDELRDLYKMGINYAITHRNRANAELAFRLYQAGFAKKILLEGVNLSRFAYKNAVSMGLYLGEYDWVESFVSESTSLLPEKYQLTYQHYALGKAYFVQKKYPEALTHLQKVEYEDIFLNLDARSTLAKIYYETEEWDVLDSHLQSFRMFLLRKKKQLGYHYEVYKSLVRFTNKLMRWSDFSATKRARLHEKITTIPTLTEREWFLKMLEEKK